MKKLLLGFILGGLIFGGAVYAVSYNASDISYIKDGVETTVGESLDELYDFKNSKPVKLENVNPFKVDTGTSTYSRHYSYWDISQLYPDYQNLTADNIVMVIKYSYGSLNGFFHHEYDSTTGIIKAYWTNVGGYNTNDNLVAGDSWHTNSAVEEKIRTIVDIYVLK